MKEQIKTLRLEIDGLSQLVNNLKPLRYIESYKDYKDSNSNEISKAYDSLILAKAWLGKLLQELGESTPYANDGNRKDVKDIEPAADVKGKELLDQEYKYVVNQDYVSKNHIQKVDYIREEVSKIVEQVKELGKPIPQYRYMVLLDENTLTPASKYICKNELVPLDTHRVELILSEKLTNEEIQSKFFKDVKVAIVRMGEQPLPNPQSREFNISRTNTYNHLSEARFWLGFELGRIRDEKS